jgi:hypothetical protein
VLLRFYCDESYDGNPPGNRRGKGAHAPTVYAVGGFFAGAMNWMEIETGWNRVNKKWKVDRYHAAHLNCGSHEYEGWDRERRRAYSQEILGVLKAQGAGLHGFAVGMYAEEYRRIINETGQLKLGHPQMACFKTLIATVAKQMDRIFPPADRFAVILDRNPLDDEQVQAFDAMRDNPAFQYRHRLETCTPASSEDAKALQAADFVAYESFKNLWRKKQGDNGLRASLESMLSTTKFHVQMFGHSSLTKLKSDIEGAHCAPGGLVIIPSEPR